jgi:dTDP-4-amino-4,6-dideoxygalactose transaminase
VQVHYVPVHWHPYYRERFGTRIGQFPEAERFYRGAISIPLYPRMEDADVERVISIVRRAAGGR